MINLTNCRKKRNLSQKGLSILIGVSRSTLAMWEIGAAQPDINSLIKLCEVLNVSANELLGTSEKLIPPEIDGKMLNNEEIELIKDFRKCRPIFKSTIQSTIKNLLKADFDCRND